MRRFIDTINEQFKKIKSDILVKITYTIKFANGVVASTSTLEDIINQENSGSAEIVRLDITSEAENNSQKYSINVTFENVDDEKSSYPVKYKIVGESRDWVFVTSSMISERIKKSKRSNLFFDFILGNNRYNGSIRSLSLMLFAVLGMIFSLSSVMSGSSKRSSQVDHLESLWRKGLLKDPIDVIMRLEKIRMKRDEIIENPLFLFKPLIYIFLVYTLGYLCVYFLNKNYPRYNFCWGDYLTSFERTETRRKNIFWVVIVGLILSILGSLIATSVLNLKWWF